MGNDFEIICIDDCSTEFSAENNIINQLEYCSYTKLDKNIGRARIRNLLATKATYNNLIFLDCDSEVVDNSYISNYTPYFNKNCAVYGGLLYKENSFGNNATLRYSYGKQTEETTAKQRTLNSYFNFSAFNCYIHKPVMQALHFDERITQYGYEDTLFGLQLQKAGIPIYHIDNPLYHTGLDSSVVFLDKTKQAIETLQKISPLLPQEYTTGFRLLKTFEKIKHFRMVWLPAFFYKHMRTSMEKNLTGNSPSLKLFSFYKLSYYCFLQTP